MSAKLQKLSQVLTDVFGDRISVPVTALGEVTIEVSAAQYADVMKTLRDNELLHFEQLIDLCGVDYATYTGYTGLRYATVVHLASLTHNWRLRVRSFSIDDEFPVIASVMDVWASANWFERESFDLYGIMYEGHNDLRRILTDYGFVGHPFRKDFPISGYVEMRYDEEQKRVVYQPVTIEPREVTPRIVREEQYGRG
ncbi:MAG TPA: NADH-quinone oxidoreductase subunit C [Rhodocyclaceae bacterium]|jgi:NADH-quinone oxidoreductase subunit C|nr:NADH-quinone oxidoreductase subunit C [Rhodocyclaceae bacterium]